MAIGRNLSRLLLRIEADNSALPRGLQQSEQMVAKFSDRASAAFALTRKAALVGAAAVTGLGVAVNKAAQSGDQIAKIADAIGLATDELQEYRAASELAGVGSENLDKGLETFAKRLGELRAGTGALFTVLDKTDSAFADQLAATESTSEALRLYLARLGEYRNEADKAALSAAAFGRAAGPQMALMVKDGIDTLDANIERARELGLVLREESTRDAEEFRDTIFLLSQVIKTNLNSALLELAPLITEIGQGFLDNLPTIRDYVASFAEWIGLIERDPQERIAEITARLAELDEQQQSFIGRVRESMAFGEGPITREQGELLAEYNQLRSEQLEDDARSIEMAERERQARAELLEQRRRQVELDAQAREATREARAAEREAAQASREEMRKRIALTEELTERLAEQAQEQADAAADARREAGATIGGIESDLADLALTGDFTAQGLRRVMLAAFRDIAHGAKAYLGGDTGSVLLNLAGQAAMLFSGPSGNAGALGAGGGRLFFGGPRQGGGRVRAGTAYTTIEGGQEEIFIPDVPGHVQPASKMRVGLPMAAAGAVAPVQVIIENHTGQVARTEERTGDGGQQQIKIIVGDFVSGDIMRGGKIGRSISETFNLQRKTIDRG